MLLTQANINMLNTMVVARWSKGLAVGSEDWKQVAGYISSNGASNSYEWLSQFPSFKEWVGSRQHKEALLRAYQVINRKFENTLDIPVTAIEDDNYGQYGDIAESYGKSVFDLKNELIFTGVANAFSTQCYDGQFFFDTDHPVYPNEDGSGTPRLVSNMQAGTGEPWMLLCTERAPKAFYLQERIKPQLLAKTNAAASDMVFEQDKISYGGRWRGECAMGFWQLAYGSKADATVQNFEDAYKAMKLVRGDGERKLGISPDLLVCGPNNQSAFESILKAAQNQGGGSNINYNKVKLLVSSWM